MSYILEALKKSEKERKREEMPGLAADHSPAPARTRGRKRRSPLVGLSVLLLLSAVAVLSYWLFHSFQEGKNAVVEEESVTQPGIQETTISPAIQEQIEKEVRQAMMEEEQMEEQAPAASPTVLPEISRSDMQVPEQEAYIIAQNLEEGPPQSSAGHPLLEELPLSVRNRVPELQFAGHVYSEVASERMIIINNRIVREGDMVGDRLALVQISREGVVLQFESSVFQVNLF